MNFKLDFDFPPLADPISHQDKLLLLGSCFSDEIGNRLTYNKFNAISNPFGTIYNPISLIDGIQLALNKKSPHFLERDGLSFCWEAHSSIYGQNQGEVEQNLKKQSKDLTSILENGEWIIFTFGTAWVYRLINEGIIAANCHKQPSAKFEKQLLTPIDIIEGFDQVRERLNQLNPNLKFLFTVSPVRHIRDGIIENNYSKAMLLQAVHEMVSKNENCHYFPSYEIVNDELRDYRFFKEDMVHPSQQAVDYVWECFKTFAFTDETKDIIDTWQKIKSSIDHKPLQPESHQHIKMLSKTLEKLKGMQDKIDVKDEIAVLSQRIEELT